MLNPLHVSKQLLSIVADFVGGEIVSCIVEAATNRAFAFAAPRCVGMLVDLEAMIGLLASQFLFCCLKSFMILSERIFETFGWLDPAGINLKKTSKGKKRKGDGPGYGLWIFRH